MCLHHLRPLCPVCNLFFLTGIHSPHSIKSLHYFFLKLLFFNILLSLITDTSIFFCSFSSHQAVDTCSPTIYNSSRFGLNHIPEFALRPTVIVMSSRLINTFLSLIYLSCLYLSLSSVIEGKSNSTWIYRGLFRGVKWLASKWFFPSLNRTYLENSSFQDLIQIFKFRNFI